MFRRYCGDQNGAPATVAIQRQTLTRTAGTLESNRAFATVSGMDAIEAVVQHMSSSMAQRVTGSVSSEMFTFVVDIEVLPNGSAIREGDRVVIASGLYNGTYDITEARLIQGRAWNCTMRLKPETAVQV
jgi:cystathionine beta-lyase/cystathionine gamma-synthase